MASVGGEVALSGLQATMTRMRYPPVIPTRWIRRALARLHRRVRGATALEWTLLLAAIALPSYFLVLVGINLLTAHYDLVRTVNALPFP